MPTALNMSVEGVTLPGVVGSVRLPGKRVSVSEALDGSSLNVSSRRHEILFTASGDLLPLLQHILGLNDTVRFSADYSTGETVRGAIVQVLAVDPRDDGDVEYVLSVNPNEAVLRQSEPGL